ncbi:MAG TPA: hypothetical protein VLH60_01795 [Sedimentisphaerales bacterium]|nr:hypothetical protein [Sedimentisphaerales bacterium]
MRSLPGRVSVAETVTGVCIRAALAALGGAVIGRGLRSLVCQRFVSEKDKSIWMEVFAAAGQIHIGIQGSMVGGNLGGLMAEVGA